MQARDARFDKGLPRAGSGCVELKIDSGSFRQVSGRDLFAAVRELDVQLLHSRNRSCP